MSLGEALNGALEVFWFGEVHLAFSKPILKDGQTHKEWNKYGQRWE